MKKIKIAESLIIFNMFYWLIYNTVFGWNTEPESDLEDTFDLVYVIIWKIAFVIYILPLMEIYRKKVKKHERKN